MYMNSVLRLCLHLRDTALEFNLPFDMCRWLVEGEDIEVVHGVLVRHHQYLANRPLLKAMEITSDTTRIRLAVFQLEGEA